MIFTNKFLRHGGGGPQPSDGRFRVSKAVAGLGSSSALYFNFQITIQKPSISTKTNYRVYVFDSPTANTPLNYTQLQSNVQNTSLISSAGYINCPIATQTTFMLKHGQYLSFSDIDAGATYVINELGTQYYRPSYALMKGGISAGTQTALNYGDGLSTPTSPPMTVTISPTQGQWTDSAAFTNTRDPITPTGIAVDDMPYVALIVIAMASLAGYLFFRIKVRKNDGAAVEA
jgi:hypothetical protein